MKVIEYEKYEFCKAVGCFIIKKHKTNCTFQPPLCIYTAKDFHQWLMNNGYKIIKETK